MLRPSILKASSLYAVVVPYGMLLQIAHRILKDGVRGLVSYNLCNAACQNKGSLRSQRVCACGVIKPLKTLLIMRIKPQCELCNRVPA